VLPARLRSAPTAHAHAGRTRTRIRITKRPIRRPIAYAVAVVPLGLIDRTRTLDHEPEIFRREILPRLSA
jgi:hypothetical protein